MAKHSPKLTSSDLDGAKLDGVHFISDRQIVVGMVGTGLLVPLPGESKFICHRMQLIVTISNHVAHDHVTVRCTHVVNVDHI
jgi:hypothetical protein